MPKRVIVGVVLDESMFVENRYCCRCRRRCTRLDGVRKLRWKLMVVQAEVTSTNANTGEMLKDSVECLAVLSDRIGSWSDQRW